MKALRRCRNNIEADNVVLIDVDTYNFNSVIVNDIPESHTKKQVGSNDKNRPLRTYIYIDDDESPCNHHAGENLENERNYENGASSSRRYGSENTSPVTLSKGKRTYSGRGFNIQSDSESSDDDELDCEFIKDFTGKLREQWEEASLKRKGVVHNDHTRSSRSYEDDHNELGVNENKQKHVQDSNFNGTGNEKDVESSDGESSDDDELDCEYVNDSSGKLREQWEKASLKRKGVVHNDHMRSSRSYGDDHSEFGLNENKQKHVQDSKFNGTSNEKEGESSDCDVMDVDGGKDDLPLGEAPSAADDDNDDVLVENSIIDQREKLKETDEYKRALEQELSARQKALQIQAEEAQQLRRMQKRKKAECLRLLDMERRQKQRVEEIREIQKKDEENLNLKEQYRTEVREELKRLEITCVDMASLLRGLGIQVGKGPVPLPHEVRAAYKRALLSFHPDRASGSDTRQQVEAEEKFKLISRMKERVSL